MPAFAKRKINAWILKSRWLFACICRICTVHPKWYFDKPLKLHFPPVCIEYLSLLNMLRNWHHKAKGQRSRPLETAINLIEHQINWVHLSCLNRSIVTYIFYGTWLNISAHLHLSKWSSLYFSTGNQSRGKVFFCFFFPFKVFQIGHCRCELDWILCSILKPLVLSIITLSSYLKSLFHILKTTVRIFCSMAETPYIFMQGATNTEEAKIGLSRWFLVTLWTPRWVNHPSGQCKKSALKRRREEGG